MSLCPSSPVPWPISAWISPRTHGLFWSRRGRKSIQKPCIENSWVFFGNKGIPGWDLCCESPRGEQRGADPCSLGSHVCLHTLLSGARALLRFCRWRNEPFGRQLLLGHCFGRRPQSVQSLLLFLEGLSFRAHALHLSCSSQCCQDPCKNPFQQHHCPQGSNSPPRALFYSKPPKTSFQIRPHCYCSVFLI